MSADSDHPTSAPDELASDSSTLVSTHGPDPLGETAPRSSEAGALRGRVRGWGIVLVGALVAGGIGLGVQRFANGEPEQGTAAPPRDVPSFQNGKIVYTPTFAEHAGIELGTVEERDVVPIVEASGTTSFDPRRVATVGPRMSARVIEVEAVLGQRVDVGDVLARLEAAELAHAQADVEVLRARAETAVAEAERKRHLAEEGIAAQRSAEIAETERRAIELELDAARQHLRALGGRAQAAELGLFALRTPLAGEIIEVAVELGQPIEPNYTAFRVADLSEVWVELAVFEHDLDRVRVGDDVVLAPRSRPEAMVYGRVEHVGAVLDAASHSVPVRVVVPNEARELAVGESVVARIRASGEAVKGPAVPRAAVTLVDGEPTVFVITNGSTVEPRQVRVSAEGEDWVGVREGVGVGDTVAVKGVFALKSELFR